MRNNNKGITVVELLVYTAISSIIIPIILSSMIYGFENYSSSTRLLKQYECVVLASSTIRRDVERAISIELSEKDEDSLIATFKVMKLEFLDRPEVYYKFEDEYFKYSTDGSDYEIISDGFEESECVFISIDGEEDVNFEHNNRTLLFRIQPIKSNKGKFSSRNFNEPVDLYLNTRYKVLSLQT